MSRVHAKTRGKGNTKIRLLLEAIAEGNEAALSHLSDRIRRRTTGLCRRYLIDENASDEVHNDTLMAIWTSRSRFDSSRGSLAWIDGICRNQIRKANRSLMRALDEKALLQSRYRDCSETTRSDDKMVDALMAKAVVHEVMQSMTPTQSSIIHLRYRLGLSHKRIAHILRIPEGTVKSRCSSARIRFIALAKAEFSNIYGL